MSNRSDTPRIVVGIDGSPGSIAALRYAWRESQLRGAGLEVVVCWHFPPMPYVLYQPPISAETFEQGAREVAGEGIRTVLADAAATADIKLTVLEGAPSLRLLELAPGAEMIVVGSRGRGGFAGLLLGSVSQHLAEHAPCPVVIVHHEADERV